MAEVTFSPRMKLMQMLSLLDREWAQIKLSDWFTVRSTNTGIDKIRLKKAAVETIPYITRTNKNNGVGAFVGEQVIQPDAGGVITIGLDTQTCFFQSKPFFTGQNIQIIESDNMNIYIALFLIPPIKKLLMKFNWGGNGATLTRLKRSLIMLPLDDCGNPDWKFMEAYIKERRTNLIEQFKEHIQEDPSRLEPNFMEIVGFQWKEFFIEEICSIHSGVRLTKADMKVGKTPFVGAVDNNNGITKFVSNINQSFKSNVLSVNYNGSVVESFYHPYDALFSDDVKQLEIKGIAQPSKYAYLFLKACILKQKNKYTYGYKFNAERMKRQIVLLPADSSGHPAWKEMADHMERQEALLLKAYLDYLD